MKPFPEQLRTARHAANLSQAECARELGLSISSIKDYERGARQPKPVHAEGILHRLAALSGRPAQPNPSQ